MQIVQELVYSERYSFSAAECYYYVSVCRLRNEPDFVQQDNSLSY